MAQPGIRGHAGPPRRSEWRDLLPQSDSVRSHLSRDRPEHSQQPGVSHGRSHRGVHRDPQATPDPLSTAYFVNFLNLGYTIEQVKALIYASPEYFADSGSTTLSYLSALYTDILNRPLDSSGIGYFGRSSPPATWIRRSLRTAAAIRSRERGAGDSDQSGRVQQSRHGRVPALSCAARSMRPV